MKKQFCGKKTGCFFSAHTLVQFNSFSCFFSEKSFGDRIVLLHFPFLARLIRLIHFIDLYVMQVYVFFKLSKTSYKTQFLNSCCFSSVSQLYFTFDFVFFAIFPANQHSCLVKHRLQTMCGSRYFFDDSVTFIVKFDVFEKIFCLFPVTRWPPPAFCILESICF